MGHVDVKVEQTVEILVQTVIAGRFLDTYVLPSMDSGNTRYTPQIGVSLPVLPPIFEGSAGEQM